MFARLGASGLVGLLVLVTGIALVAYANLIVAAGIALVVIGLALVLYGLLSGLLSAFGMGGAF